MEFTPINTQEEYQQKFNSDLGDRLRKNEEKWQKKFEGYISPEDFEAKTKELQKQIDAANSAVDGLSKKNAEYEKSIKSYEINAIKHKVAHENGLSYDAIDFIQGNDEETIKASAEKFKSLMGKSSPAPSFSNEPQVNNDKNASLRKMAQTLAKNN